MPLWKCRILIRQSFTDQRTQQKISLVNDVTYTISKKFPGKNISTLNIEYVSPVLFN